MAKYYRHYLDSVTSPPDVPLSPLKGGQISKSSRAHAVFDGLDKVVGCGRRILMSQSLSGSNRFIVADTGTPASSTNRICARSKADLTPGSMLGMSVLYLPGGDTSDEDGYGQVQLDVTWTDRDGDTAATTHTLTLEADPDGDTDTELWNGLRVRHLSSIRPGSLVSITSMQNWSRFTHVELTLSVNGNTRIVDAVVYERPYSIALEADDDADYWVSGMFASGGPGGSPPNLNAPLQRMSETTPDGNPRGGSWMLMDEANAQVDNLGPVLFHWTGHIEDSDSASTEEDGYLLATAATSTWTRVPDGATGTIAATTGTDQPGWSMASGAYSKPPGENPDESMGRTGSIPVRVKVRLSSDDAAFLENFDFRIYASPYSYIQITGTAPDPSAPEWFSAYGHLKCGKGPGDNVKATAILQRTTGTGDVRIYDIVCYRATSISEAFPALPTDGLVFHMDARDSGSYPGSGTTVTDLITSDTATASNLTSLSPDFEFNGSNSVIEFSNNDDWENIFDGGGTVVQIFNADNNGEAGFGRLVTTREFTPDSNGWATSINSTEVALYQNFSSNAGRWDAAITHNDWYIAIFTYDNDSTANNPTLYLNGSVTSLTETDTPSGTRNTDDTNSLTIGNHPTTDRTWDGEINVVMLYDRAITADEAAQIFNYYDRTYNF